MTTVPCFERLRGQCNPTLLAAHVRALTAAHAERTKSLLRSIDKLKAEAASLRSANEEHHRSAHMRTLQRRLREQELVADVLKQALRESTSLDPAQIDDMVMKKTIAGPLRFRPQVRAYSFRALLGVICVGRCSLVNAPADG